MIRRFAIALLMLAAALWIGVPVGATETATESAWDTPDQPAVEMFRQGDRVFGVGTQSGGAGGGGGTERWPKPGGGPTFPNSRCAMSSGGCSGVCVSYLNYYCDLGVCGSFEFCD